MKPITREGELNKAQEGLVANLFKDSFSQTAEALVADYDPQRADELTREMIGTGLLVPVRLGSKIRGLSFMPVEF